MLYLGIGSIMKSLTIVCVRSYSLIGLRLSKTALILIGSGQFSSYCSETFKSILNLDYIIEY